jgi:hypothetical protein
MLKALDAKKKVLEEIMDFADESLLSKVSKKGKPSAMEVEISATSEEDPELDLAAAADEGMSAQDDLAEDDLKVLIENYLKEREEDEEEHTSVIPVPQT